MIFALLYFNEVLNGLFCMECFCIFVFLLMPVILIFIKCMRISVCFFMIIF